MTFLLRPWEFALRNPLLVGSATVSMAVTFWIVGSLVLDIVHFNDPRHSRDG